MSARSRSWKACAPIGKGRTTPCVISGAIGPRGDGYKAGNMDAAEAEAYHAAQIAAFVEGGADMVTAYTLNSINEAIGIARAAKASGFPR